jgi:hypothetical protein
MPLICTGAKRAGDGNRTRMTSLEGWGSTIELRPRDGGGSRRSRRAVTGSVPAPVPEPVRATGALPPAPGQERATGAPAADRPLVRNRIRRTAPSRPGR